MAFIKALEKALSNALGREVVFEKVFEPMKPWYVLTTYACMDLLEQAVGFKPKTLVVQGPRRFADWYVGYFGVK